MGSLGCTERIIMRDYVDVYWVDDIYVGITFPDSEELARLDLPDED